VGSVKHDAQRSGLGEGWEIYSVACLATKDSISLSQITEAGSEFLLLMGEIRQPNFCQAIVVRSCIF
jgi:hypothetical protein